MKHRDNNVTYGIQKEFDTYTKFVLEFIVSNILANISAENEQEETYMIEEQYLNSEKVNEVRQRNRSLRRQFLKYKDAEM